MRIADPPALQGRPPLLPGLVLSTRATPADAPSLLSGGALLVAEANMRPRNGEGACDCRKKRTENVARIDRVPAFVTASESTGRKKWCLACAVPTFLRSPHNAVSRPDAEVDATATMDKGKAGSGAAHHGGGSSLSSSSAAAAPSLPPNAQIVSPSVWSASQVATFFIHLDLPDVRFPARSQPHQSWI